MPWRFNTLPGIKDLSLQYQVQLIAMDTFALIFGAIIFRYCSQAQQFQRATQRIVAQFEGRLPKSIPPASAAP